MRLAIYQANVSDYALEKECIAMDSYMLVDQNNADILALFGKPFKGGFDGLRIGLVVHD